MSELLCPHCLQPLRGRYEGDCPHCGRSLENRNPEGALPLGTQLAGKYTAVSYTHLDVYKRQDPRHADAEHRRGCCPPERQNRIICCKIAQKALTSRQGYGIILEPLGMGPKSVRFTCNALQSSETY